MTDADVLVSQWVVKEFKDDRFWGRHIVASDETVAHLNRCSDTQFSMADHGWECGCYSSVTREDAWKLHGTIYCSHDISMEYSTSAYEWENGLPGLLRDLIIMDHNPCYFESEEYRNRSYDY